MIKVFDKIFNKIKNYNIKNGEMIHNKIYQKRKIFNEVSNKIKIFISKI